MADFNQSISIVFANEGGFNKNLGDGEGMTYRGLTENSDSDWDGWNYIKNYINQNGYPSEEYIFPELEDSVKSYYKQKYWQLAKGDALQNQDMGNLVFSFFVNTGRAGKEITLAINNALGDGTVPVKNGALSQDDVDVMNNNQDTVYSSIYNQRENYLHSLSNYGKYSKSWERMMAMFPSTTTIQRFLSSKDGFYTTVVTGVALIGISGYMFYLYKKGIIFKS